MTCVQGDVALQHKPQSFLQMPSVFPPLSPPEEHMLIIHPYGHIDRHGCIVIKHKAERGSRPPPFLGYEKMIYVYIYLATY